MVPKSMALLSVASMYWMLSPAPKASQSVAAKETAGLMLTVVISDSSAW